MNVLQQKSSNEDQFIYFFIKEDPIFLHVTAVLDVQPLSFYQIKSHLPLDKFRYAEMASYVYVKACSQNMIILQPHERKEAGLTGLECSEHCEITVTV